MRILALDPAINTGWAYGESRIGNPSCVISGSTHLVGADEPFSQLIINATVWLREKIGIAEPELVCAEQWLPTAAQKREEAVDSSRLLHGAYMAVCALHKVPYVTVSVQTWRKHFIGRANATKAQKELNPLANKKLVWDRAKILGYVSRDTTPDFDRSDAIGIYDYAAAIYGRAVPSTFTLFSAGA